MSLCLLSLHHSPSNVSLRCLSDTLFSCQTSSLYSLFIWLLDLLSDKDVQPRLSSCFCPLNTLANSLFFSLQLLLFPLCYPSLFTPFLCFVRDWFQSCSLTDLMSGCEGATQSVRGFRTERESERAPEVLQLILSVVLKYKFTQKWKCSRYLLTTMLLESLV